MKTIKRSRVRAKVRGVVQPNDYLRRVVSMMNYSTESALEGFTPEEVLLIFDAVLASESDVMFDNLSAEQLRDAAKLGHVPAFDDDLGAIPAKVRIVEG
jgi:hypothetical protein